MCLLTPATTGSTGVGAHTCASVWTRSGSPGGPSHHWHTKASCHNFRSDSCLCCQWRSDHLHGQLSRSSPGDYPEGQYRPSPCHELQLSRLPKPEYTAGAGRHCCSTGLIRAILLLCHVEVVGHLNDEPGWLQGPTPPQYPAGTPDTVGQRGLRVEEVFSWTTGLNVHDGKFVGGYPTSPALAIRHRGASVKCSNFGQVLH